MIIGFIQAIPSQEFVRMERTCGEDERGEIVGVHVNPAISNNFVITQFGVRHKDGREDWLVHGVEKVTSWADDTGTCRGFVLSGPGGGPPASFVRCTNKMPIPSVNECPVCKKRNESSWSNLVDATCFIALAEACPVELEVDEGDTIVVVAGNITGSSHQTFSMAVRLLDRSISRSSLWWANIETGKLERALTFPERNLSPGSRNGDLVVVNPATYEGFDRELARN